MSKNRLKYKGWWPDCWKVINFKFCIELCAWLVKSTLLTGLIQRDIRNVDCCSIARGRYSFHASLLNSWSNAIWFNLNWTLVLIHLPIRCQSHTPARQEEAKRAMQILELIWLPKKCTVWIGITKIQKWQRISCFRILFKATRVLKYPNQRSNNLKLS